MLLYHSDWARYPSATLHLETKNKSFIRLASVYRSMNIRNHGFMLALINPDLRYVDPFDPNLTMEQMAAIALEASVNPFFSLENVFVFPQYLEPILFH